MIRIEPAQSEFVASYQEGSPCCMWTRVISDLETPVSALLKLNPNTQACFMLESVHGGQSRGRYSIIGLEPDMMWRCYGNRAEISYTPSFSEDSFAPVWQDSISALKALIREHRMTLPESLPPMAAGLIGYMGYDMIKLVERLPSATPDTIGIPDACFIRPRVMLIFDSVAGEIFIVTTLWKPEGSADSVYSDAVRTLNRIAEQLQGPVDQRNYYKERESDPVTFTSNTTPEQYTAIVEKAKNYIRGGDIFQVVPSQRFSAPFTLPPFALYRALRHLNPSPFLFFLNFGGYALVGSSPEILVRLRDDTVTIRPIAGTRKRGKNKAEDDAFAADLLSDPKELSEHLMLLDLGRNDVGRVSTGGSVKVTEKMIIEYYSHVMHIVSQVEGTLDTSRFDAMDALMAGFPAGTTSGNHR
jgi:anthranilate synthase component I